MLFILAMLFTSSIHGQTTSALWGVNGENWDPDDTTSRLRNFTNVGYMNGDVPIPDWPVGVNILDYGAIPNDGLDDSQAIIDAIAACPPSHAVLVPKGEFTLLNQINITDKDYFVLRGEDMYESVLHCPKYLGEIIVNYKGTRNGFFLVEGGTHRSIENLSFKFRDQPKGTAWEHRGVSAIYYIDGTENSWIRNIYIYNSNRGITCTAVQNISVINITLDHYINRPRYVVKNLTNDDTDRQTAFVSIGMNGVQYSLFHNIEIKGNALHDFNLISGPNDNVVSQVTGERANVQYHGLGNRRHLYTDFDIQYGVVGSVFEEGRQYDETYWGYTGERLPTQWADDPDNLIGGHVFVGFDYDFPTTIEDDFYFESVDYESLQPKNIYLAQMEKVGKPLPEAPQPTVPLPKEEIGDVRIINPIADSDDAFSNPQHKALQFNSYIKFDLSGMQDLNTIARVRFRVHPRSLSNFPFTAVVSAVEDDSWLEAAGQIPPIVGAELDSLLIESKEADDFWLEFDVTDFVTEQWNGDKLVSFHLKGVTAKNSTHGNLYSRHLGGAPQLVIEQQTSSVAGAPAAPAEVKTDSQLGYIELDWEDNTEDDFKTYNVYRIPYVYNGPIASGLTMSEYRDISQTPDRGLYEMKDTDVFFYKITAVDEHENESVVSTQVVGTTLSETNTPPDFDDTALTLPLGRVGRVYSGSIGLSARDPEGDTLYYVKISGPAWLDVAFDGTLSGAPPADSEGNFEVLIQVNALGGYDRATFNGAILPPVTDADNDQMADTWENTYFSGREAEIDGSGDSDGDEVTDFFEYLYGSDPTTPSGDGFKLRMPARFSGQSKHIGEWSVKEEFELGPDYLIKFSTDLNTWETLPSDHYRIEQNSLEGRTRNQLELIEDYPDGFFMRLSKP